MASISSDTKIVLITGANQGIGKEIAKQLTTQYKNFHVLIGSRSIPRGEAAATELEKLGCSVEPIQIDVSDDTSIKNAALLVKAKFGYLDVLVNNAGTYLELAPVPTDNLRETFLKTFDVNVFGAAITTEIFAPLLNASPAVHPKVIFTSSTLGSLSIKQRKGTSSDDKIVPVYRSSKAALNMLTLHFADVGRKRGWIVDCFCPGYVPTSLTGFQGAGPVELGVAIAIKLVVEDGETGNFVDNKGVIAW